MSKINIKVNQVKAANKDLVNLSSRVDGVGNRISSDRHQVDGRIASRRSIGRNLNEAAAKVREAEKKLKKIHQFVDVSMDLYVKADKKADRLKEPEKKSVWDKMKDMFGTANDVVSGFRKGLAEAVFSTVEGIWNAITHPIETAKGIVYAISHPVETAKSIWKSISDSWKNDVINGDAKSRSQWFGRAVGEVALAIIGTKGVDKAVKMAKGAKVVEEAGGVRVVKPETIEKKDGGAAVEKRVTPEKKESGIVVEKKEVSQKIDGNGGIGDTGFKATRKSEILSKYSTAIDDKVKVIEKIDLPDWISESFTDGNYRTVITEEKLTFYRTYGGGAKVNGSFVTTSPAGNRINAKINTALVPDWKNSRQYEAVIEVPKGQILNIGRVEKQYTKTGALLEGDGDQILLPQGWPSDWIKETREVPSK
ncbi:hypothetical protein [Mesobacillus selenatarsenatis]|uniref:YeeF n=1 Tax=Mesobacillus selenatarsenatis (strain DSM 18680 / JCM 14380 / FERM P-15431 / SF-1) TaxID=1321606 RepID=A0A0A8X1C2_MESS1|nr:hypothetical protein [Mesobacillus selenatarsenatis]GAM12827.1 YeeF [Mesobacillus selenatarsenatis SF-1]